MADEKDDSRRQMIRTIGMFTVIVAELVGTCGAGLALGYVAWKYWGFPSWTIAVTALLGISGGFYRVYQISKKEWGA